MLILKEKLRKQGLVYLNIVKAVNRSSVFCFCSDLHSVHTSNMSKLLEVTLQTAVNVFFFR